MNMTEQQMDINTITAILNAHGIKYTIDIEGVHALNEYILEGEYGCDWTNLSDYSRDDLYEWLGY